MDRATLRRSIDLLLASPATSLSLQFYGGEPLLERDNLSWAVEYADAHKRADQILEYSLTTNGTLLDDDSLGFLSRHDFQVQLSFDGVPEVQRHRSRDSFEKLDRLLQTMRSEYESLFETRLRIAMTLTPLTIEHFAESVAYFLEQDAREIEVAPAITAVPRWQEDWRDALTGQFDRITGLSLDHHRRTGRVPFLPLRKKSSGPKPLPRSLSMCGVAGTDDIAVDVDGAVHGCVMFARSFQVRPSPRVADHFDRMRIGSITADRANLAAGLEKYPQEVKNAGYFHDRQKKRSPYRQCGECEFLARCSVCPVSIGNLPHNDDPHLIPGFLCAWNLVSLRAQDLFQQQLVGSIPITSLPLPAEIMGPGGPRRVELRDGRAVLR